MIAAAAPLVVLLLLLGVFRRPAWMSALAGLLTAVIVAALSYQMPPDRILGAITFGAAFGLFPIGWVVFSAILLYNITVETGQFEIVKNSIGHLTGDRRIQALLIAFAFGAFIEGAAGFGTPVAVAAAMLAGLGFSPFYAAGICLLANTAPVAFGSIGIPLTTLAGVTGLPLARLSAGVGRICAPVSLFIPAYLILVMGGWPALRGVLPAAAVCGLVFAAVQFGVSNFIGPELTDILSSTMAMAAIIGLLQVWKPKDQFTLRDDTPQKEVARAETGHLFRAWSPYALLVVFMLLWGVPAVQAKLNLATRLIPWPGTSTTFKLNWLSASGTACLFAGICAAALLGVSPARFGRILGKTARQLVISESTIAIVLGLAYLMNFSGATKTLGLGFAATGSTFPFFSALLGWLGVFLTGSDTSANALFGDLQKVTATSLNMNPVLMASANSAGGVMGKMISLTSIAVAVAASGMTARDESRLFRFTLKHSIFLASVIGCIALLYATVLSRFAP
jgi:L-lactate transport